MVNTRELRSRIKSVSSTKKITKAQELIAASRIVKAQAHVKAALPYAQELTKAINKLVSSVTDIEHILIAHIGEVRRAGIFIITSDRGMCGGYNSNVYREVDRLITSLRTKNIEPVLFVTGSKGISHYLFKNIPLGGAWSGFSQSPKSVELEPAIAFLDELLTVGSTGTVPFPQFSHAATEALLPGTSLAGIDELHLVSTHFESMITQKPQVRRLAPLEVHEEESGLELHHGVMEKNSPTPQAEYVFEPEPEVLLKLLLPRYLGTRIFAATLDSAASESASRRAAMKAATDNADDLEKNLKRQANLARQAQITSEISEIVGTTSALGS